MKRSEVNIRHLKNHDMIISEETTPMLFLLELTNKLKRSLDLLVKMTAVFRPLIVFCNPFSTFFFYFCLPLHILIISCTQCLLSIDSEKRPTFSNTARELCHRNKRRVYILCKTKTIKTWSHSLPMKQITRSRAHLWVTTLSVWLLRIMIYFHLGFYVL